MRGRETAVSHKALQKAALHLPSELLKIIINMQGRDVSCYSLNWGTPWYMHQIYQGLSSPPYPTEESSRAHVFFPPHTLTAPSIISCQYAQTLFNLGSRRSCWTRGVYCCFTSEKWRQARTAPHWRSHSENTHLRAPALPRRLSHKTCLP